MNTQGVNHDHVQTAQANESVGRGEIFFKKLLYDLGASVEVPC